MTTRDAIQEYFDSLSRKRRYGQGGISGSDEAFLFHDQGTRGQRHRGGWRKACVLTRYELELSGGPAFESHVAEVFEVRDGKIKSFEIYFDSAAFPR